MNITITRDDSEFVCTDLRVEGFEYPTVNSAIEDISGMDGAVYVASKFGRRSLSWEGVLSSDILDSRRILTKTCRPGQLKTIAFETCDGLALQAEVEVTNIVMPYRLGRTKYMINAVAPDPRFYSQELVSVDISQTSIRGGAAIPLLSIPMAIPQSALTDQELNSIVTNEGTQETDPVFTIYGPGTGFIVTNTTTGEEFTLSSTLIEGDYVTIDVAAGTVVLNGITNIYDEFAGDFIILAPGDNDFEFIVEADLDVTTLLNVEYRHAYLGI